MKYRPAEGHRKALVENQWNNWNESKFKSRWRWSCQAPSYCPNPIGTISKAAKGINVLVKRISLFFLIFETETDCFSRHQRCCRNGKTDVFFLVEIRFLYLPFETSQLCALARSRHSSRSSDIRHNCWLLRKKVFFSWIAEASRNASWVMRFHKGGWRPA